MAYKGKISRKDIDEEIVCNPTGPQWMRHNQCGHRFFYLFDAVSAVLAVYCPKCKMNVLLIIGVDIKDLDSFMKE